MKSLISRFAAPRHAAKWPAVIALVVANAATVLAAPRTLTGHIPDVVRTFNLQPVGRLEATNRLQLVIGLPLRDTNALASLIQQIYDPASTNFHRYLSPAQFTARFGPAQQDYQTVLDFARTNHLDIGNTYDDRVLLDVSAPVSVIESAFHIKLLTYQHPTEARRFFAPDTEPTVDGAVPIIFIKGLNNIFVPRPMARPMPAGSDAGSSASGGSGPKGFFRGYDFRNAYAPGVSLTGSGQNAGLVELEGYLSSDISTYESQAGLPGVPIQNIPIDGFTANLSNSNGVLECSLDIEMVISMAPGLNKLYVFEDNSDTDHILYSMVSSNQIKQFSTSWGMSQDPMAEGYLMRMASQGQTFFAASGDGDAYISACGAIPWPSDDLYVTSVGGTFLTMTNSGSSYVSEVVWNSGFVSSSNTWYGNCMSGYWGSGGGVSTSFGMPLWQQSVNVSAVGGSTSGRNIPDVALTAQNVWDNYDGTTSPVMGTSCAAPLWCGFTALINQQAALNGLSPVGFLNPAFYAIGQGPSYIPSFNDITFGNNEWASSTTAFVAAPGWDLCTGWGTPNGTNIINALMFYAGVVWVDFNYTGTNQLGTYNNPYETLAQGTNAVQTGGTIWIRTAGHTLETMTISKPMSIRAYNGAANIGD